MKICNLVKTGILFLALTVSGLFTSCEEKIMGYSVLLWNLSDYNLQSGDIVPVYVRSNITQVYIAETPDGEKIEIPLWQLTSPVKEKMIGAEKEKYAEYAHTYAASKIDGLPCRAEAVNTSKQVYRLRKGEVIKVLYSGEGQVVMAGQTPLEGDWLRVLASDGTQGWCFSYNLALYETDATGARIGGVEEEIEELDTVYDSILNKAWYPDSYTTLITNGNIDTSKLSASNYFMIDTENEKVIFNAKTEVRESWPYTGYTKTDDNQYTLNDIPMIIIYKKPGYIVCRYTDDSGKPVEYNMVILEQNITEVLSKENQRRAQAYKYLVDLGSGFTSAAYGNLVLNEDGTFTWMNFDKLDIIDKKAQNKGTAYVKYALGKNLAGSYDGVLSFVFDGTETELNFLYKYENGRLRMEDAVHSTYNGNLVTNKSSNPIIISFAID